jgi:hypothetical protein
MIDLIEFFSNYGVLGVVALVSMSLTLWLLRENQKTLDQCNARVDRLIETHIGFVKNVTEKMDELLRDIGKLIDKAEITIEELEKARGWKRDA